MIETSQWRASIGGFHSRQKRKLEIPMRWKQSLSKPQPEPVAESKPARATETKKVTPTNDTATPAIHIELRNTFCVTLLVGLHSKYILYFYFY